MATGGAPAGHGEGKLLLAIADIQIEFSADNGATWTPIAASAPNDGAPDFPDGGVGVRLVRQEPVGTAVDEESWGQIKKESR